MAQLNFPISPNCFITITYQSNNYLNEELDNQVKKEIAKILVKTVDVKNIHSYVHGQIIIEVPHKGHFEILRTVTKALSKPMAESTPSLIYSADLAAFGMSKMKKLTSLIYVEGDEEMNNNFVESIKEFWPYK